MSPTRNLCTFPWASIKLQPADLLVPRLDISFLTFLTSSHFFALAYILARRT
uniref:Uncharacterized protein n=1 Tax=Arundo donax TaxID=35708 RepID=A0A0A8Z343_ARUDO